MTAVKYRMIFCDIDGTLIDSSYQIPPDTTAKIQELARMGIPFVLASARMPSGIAPLQRELGICAPMICYSGALILDEKGAQLKSIGIPRDQALDIEAYVKTQWQHISCSAFSGDQWLVDSVQDSWVVQEQEITTSQPVEGQIAHHIPPEGQVHKFLCMGEGPHIAGLNQALRERYPGLAVHRSKDTYLEIMDSGATKSGAVRYLCHKYGIPIEATVSFGDNFNDVDMLLATGTCFAMGNAPDEVKQQVKNVTLDNDHQGVLAGLMQLHFAENRVPFITCL